MGRAAGARLYPLCFLFCKALRRRLLRRAPNRLCLLDSRRPLLTISHVEINNAQVTYVLLSRQSRYRAGTVYVCVCGVGAPQPVYSPESSPRHPLQPPWH